MESVTITMAELLTQISSIFTTFIGQVATVASTIAGSPLLLLAVSLPVAMLAIGIFKRLITVNM